MPRLVIRGYGGRPTLPAPTIEGETFFDVLRAYLKTIPELDALTEIYYRRTPPKGVTAPYLVVSPVADSPEINNSGDYWQRAQIEFAVIAVGPDCDVQAEKIGQAAYRALAPKRRNDAGKMVPRPKFKSTYAYEMTALPGGVQRVEQPGRSPGNQAAIAFHFRYTFLVGRSMGVNP